MGKIGSAMVVEPAAGAREVRRGVVASVLERARESGLTSGKTGRIAGRVSPELIERAKARSGLTSDSALIEYALASLAVEDGFADAFKSSKAMVDPGLDLEF